LKDVFPLLHLELEQFKGEIGVFVLVGCVLAALLLPVQVLHLLIDELAVDFGDLNALYKFGLIIGGSIF
jgi:hypothetical protein